MLKRTPTTRARDLMGGPAGRRIAGTSGYTMAEVLVATGLAGVILAGAVYMFGQSVDVSTIATLRGEMQQNARVGINLIYRDILVAGTGLPTGGVQLPNPIPGNLYPQLGCDMTMTCWIVAGGAGTAAAGLNYYNTPTTFPALTTATSWMYWINPQDGQGPLVAQPNTPTGSSVDRDPWGSATATVNTDAITIVYKDNNYPVTWQGSAGAPLDQYPVCAINVTGSPTTVTLYSATNPSPTDPAYGLNQGDILFFNNSNGTAVGTVTGVGTTGACSASMPSSATTGGVPVNYTTSQTGTIVQMATNSDPLNFNYVECPTTGTACSGSGGLSSIQNGAPAAPAGTFPMTTAFRLVVVTYYIDNYTYAYPRLMRQVNGLAPTPVAQNIENLQFSYDVFDSTANTICPNIANPYNPSTAACSTGSSYSPNHIGKVNIFVQARTSGQRLVGRGYSRVSLISAVTPRNLDFVQKY